jgi:protoporphyrinogen oxidase
MKVGIIGGGIMGMSIGYYLSQKGAEVEIFEAGPTLGGLAGSFTLEDGTTVDRFYHAILSSDNHLRQLCEELGIEEQLRFHETGMGFLYKSKIHPMNNIIEFLRFPPLGWIDRFRLGITVLYAQFIHDWHKLEKINVEKWLIGLSGKRTYKNIWRPMLKAKFDGSFENTPATYIWARLVRMKSTRSGAKQKEEAGHLIGGYNTLIQALEKRITAKGGKILLNTPITKILIEENAANGILAGGEIHNSDKVISTLALPITPQIIPEASTEYKELLAKTSYLGIICPLIVLDRSLTNFWTINLTDEVHPFTGVIETTTYIDPKYVGGSHLVYLPKYTMQDSPYQKMSDEEIKEIWLEHLEVIFPNFDRNWIRYFIVQRARYVEPLHPLNGYPLIPSTITPIKNIYLSTNAQIYPTLTNGESIVHKAWEVSELIMTHIAG